MTDKTGTQAQETQKAKVVLVGIENEKNRYEVVKVLASQLGLTFEESGDILQELPVELIPSIPQEAGDKFADKLREAGADVEVLPIGKSSGRFCHTHPHRRARARCAEPGCNRFICEICIIGAKGKLLCPDCYTRYKRRRVLIGLGSVAGLFLVLWAWMMYGDLAQRWFKRMYVETSRVALVITGREMTESLAGYFERMANTEHPGEYRPGDSHTFPDLDGWFQREFVRSARGEIDILELDTYGIYELTGVVPKPGRSESLTWQGVKATRAYHRFFKDILDVNGLDLGAYDAVLFIEMVADTGVENDYVEQLGVIHDDVGYMKLPLAGKHSNDYYVQAAAFYVARLLGATPHLDDRGYPEFPAGYADPKKVPRHPQEASELMGVYVPFRAFEIRRANTMDNIVIGSETAFELGWLTSASRDAAYAGITP